MPVFFRPCFSSPSTNDASPSRFFAAISAGTSVFERLKLVNRRGSGSEAINRDEFNQRHVLDDYGSPGQVENLVRIFLDVRQLGRVVSSPLGASIGRLERDPTTIFRPILSIAERFVEVGLVAALHLVDRHVSNINPFIQMVGEIVTDLSGRWRCLFFVINCELRRCPRQYEVE